ncbi:MAG: DegT/DnrJ/EryC1/StrS family aminotransferase [Bacteroidota bacterium]
MQIPFFDLVRQNRALEADYQKIFKRFLEMGQTILGEEVLAFEREFSVYTGSKYCVTCGNATDALEIVLASMGIGPGDEVIVPSFGWVSVVSAVLNQGSTPVFVDVKLDGNIDPQLIIKKISARTKAILLIHLYGHPADIKEIRSISKSSGIRLIEDCAQAHGARVDDIHVGNFGDIGIFSFYPTKNLGALGDAGAIITNNVELSTRFRELRDYGRNNQNEFNSIGRNSRMDELQAAILRFKLQQLDRWISLRRNIANQYNEVLGDYIKAKDSVWYKYVFLVKDRPSVIKKLSQKGIHTGIYYPFQLDNLGFYPSGKPSLSIAEKLSNTTLSLPLFPEMTNEEISYICEELISIKKYTL